MRSIHLSRQRLLPFVGGGVGALLMLAAVTRPGRAEKAYPDNCTNASAAVCRTIETCGPKGFEPDGSCRWIYTVKSWYWR